MFKKFKMSLVAFAVAATGVLGVTATTVPQAHAESVGIVYCRDHAAYWCVWKDSNYINGPLFMNGANNMSLVGWTSSNFAASYWDNMISSMYNNTGSAMYFYELPNQSGRAYFQNASSGTAYLSGTYDNTFSSVRFYAWPY